MVRKPTRRRCASRLRASQAPTGNLVLCGWRACTTARRARAGTGWAASRSTRPGGNARSARDAIPTRGPSTTLAQRGRTSRGGRASEQRPGSRPPPPPSSLPSCPPQGWGRREWARRPPSPQAARPGVAPGGLRGPGHVRAAALPASRARRLSWRGGASFSLPGSGASAGRGQGEALGPGRGRSWGRAWPPLRGRGGGRASPHAAARLIALCCRRRPGLGTSADGGVAAAPSALAVGEGARGNPPEPDTTLPSRFGLGLWNLPASGLPLLRGPRGPCVAFKTFRRGLGGN